MTEAEGRARAEDNGGRRAAGDRKTGALAGASVCPTAIGCPAFTATGGSCGAGDESSTTRIADQPVGVAEGIVVHRARGRDTDMPEAEPAGQFLQARLGARSDDLDHIRPEILQRLVATSRSGK